MKVIQFLRMVIVMAIFFACNNHKETSIELLGAPDAQDSVFRNLISLTQGALPEDVRDDSLAFLILPVQASCPACRNKTIDSIAKYAESLPTHHYIIISANGGRKTIRGFFRERDKELPLIPTRLFLDSVNLAKKYTLYDAKPTMYYTYKKKAYKKVAAIPTTVKDDLREFFTGVRNENNLK